MMPLNDIDKALIEPIFTSNFSSELGVGTFYVMIERFTDIVEESSLKSELSISTNKARNSLGNIGYFF